MLEEGFSDTMKCGVILLLIGLSHGFLLDSGNSSVHVKPAYVTISEYYDGQSKTQGELRKIQQDLLNKVNQEELQRTLNLLTSQIQAKLDGFEHKLLTKTSTDPSQASFITTTLEQEINKLKNDSDTWKQMYQNLATDFKRLEQNNAQLQQEVSTLKTENQFLKKDSTAMHGKVDDLMSLKSIDQLQTINKLQQETQNLDLKVRSLESTEQARGQDLFALYKKVNTLETNEKAIEGSLKSDLSSLQNNMTNLIYSAQMKQDNALETLKNETNRVVENNNASLTQLNQRIDNEFKPVVLTACHLNAEWISPGIIKFSTIKTSVGVPDLSAYQSTGKFTCHEPGYYYVMTTIESDADGVEIQIMLNSTEQHRQHVTGYTKDGKYYTPGAAAITLNLKTNDQVWISLTVIKTIWRSCLNIFKIK